MNQKKVKPVYVAPQAIDLSPMNANGQVHPQGECVAGSLPYASCVTGTKFGLSCAIGGTPDTSFCSTGSYHSTPTCDFGGSAATICLSGANQQW
jgi:hypothetical protein